MSTDARVGQARVYADSHQQPVSQLPPSALIRQLEDTRRHLAAVLSAISTGVDSESWTCAGCGGQMIGHRPADDLCADCRASRPVADRPMDTSDLDPETGECWGAGV